MRELTNRAGALALMLLSIAGCAVGGTGVGDGAAVARIPSTSAKADGDEGAAYWDVYVDDESMTWVGTDGTREDRLFFHADADTLWLDVDRDGLPLATLGVAMSGDVVAMPDDAALTEVGQLLDEAFRDSDAVALEASKEDVVSPPPACAEERDLTVGQVLRVCASTFGALWRLSTGRYEDHGLWTVLEVFADVATPAACTGGLASLVHFPGSLSSYCANPGRLQVTSATLTCPTAGSPVCNLAVRVSATGNLPDDVIDWDAPRIEVFGPTGEKAGWGFTTKGEGATWSDDDIMVWDVDPNATYQVVVTSDYMVRSEATVRLTR